nr:ATP-binding protein [Sphaerisporangium perillae]
MAAGQYDAAGAGVEIQTPQDPDTEIRALPAAGEGPYMEYKRQLPDTTFDSKRKMLKTITAFANGHGGTIMFGVDPDEVTVVGLKEDYKDIRDRLDQLIEGNITPPDPGYRIQPHTVGDKLVVILKVEAWQNTASRHSRTVDLRPASSWSARAAGRGPAAPLRVLRPLVGDLAVAGPADLLDLGVHHPMGPLMDHLIRPTLSGQLLNG